MSDEQSQQQQPDGSRRIEFETKPVSETVKINWVVQDLRGMLELLETGAATAWSFSLRRHPHPDHQCLTFFLRLEDNLQKKESVLASYSVTIHLADDSDQFRHCNSYDTNYETFNIRVYTEIQFYGASIMTGIPAWDYAAVGNEAGNGIHNFVDLATLKNPKCRYLSEEKLCKSASIRNCP
jgi:hypothetical protein